MTAGPKPPCPSRWCAGTLHTISQAFGHFCKRPFTNVLLICRYAHPKAREVMPTKLPKATLSLRAWITAG